METLNTHIHGMVDRDEFLDFELDGAMLGLDCGTLFSDLQAVSAVSALPQEEESYNFSHLIPQPQPPHNFYGINNITDNKITAITQEYPTMSFPIGSNMRCLCEDEVPHTCLAGMPSAPPNEVFGTFVQYRSPPQPRGGEGSRQELIPPQSEGSSGLAKHEYSFPGICLDTGCPRTSDGVTNAQDVKQCPIMDRQDSLSPQVVPDDLVELDEPVEEVRLPFVEGKPYHYIRINGCVLKIYLSEEMKIKEDIKNKVKEEIKEEIKEEPGTERQARKRKASGDPHPLHPPLPHPSLPHPSAATATSSAQHPELAGKDVRGNGPAKEQANSVTDQRRKAAAAAIQSAQSIGNDGPGKEKTQEQLGVEKEPEERDKPRGRRQVDDDINDDEADDVDEEWQEDAPKRYKYTRNADGFFHCPKCPSRFRTQNNLSRHVTQHSESFPCDICGFILARKDYIKNHQNTKRCRNAGKSGKLKKAKNVRACASVGKAG